MHFLALVIVNGCDDGWQFVGYGSGGDAVLVKSALLVMNRLVCRCCCFEC